MSEICYQFSKVKGNRFARLPRPSSEARLRSRGSLNETLLLYTLAITWPIRPMSVLLAGQSLVERTSGSRMTKFASMSGAGSGMAGHRNSLPDALKNFILNYLSAMKPFTNGSMPMPENSFRHFFGLTVTASDEAIHGVTRRPIFRRGCRSKNALNMFNRVRSQGTGRQTRLSRVKAGKPYKLALNERPGLPKLLNCLGKGLTP